MIVRVVLVFLLLAVTACQSNIAEQELPDDLIDQTEMKRILYDISVLESAIEIRYGSLTKHRDITKKSIENYLDANQIDTVQFRKSLDYYHGNFGEGIAIYDLILDSLTLSSGH